MPEDPKEMVRRLIALLNAGRMSELDEILANSRRTLAPTGPRAMRRFFHKLQGAFPDCSVTENALIAEEGRVALLAEISGTHTGKIYGVPPTSRRVLFRTMQMWRLVEGRLTEHRGVIDLLGLLLQLGAVPGVNPPAEPAGRVDSGSADPAESKAVARRFHEASSALIDSAEIERLLAPGYVDHTPFLFEGRKPGSADRLQGVELVRAVFPDLSRTVEIQIVEGDLVVSAVTDTGTYGGPSPDAQLTGRPVKVPGINIDRVQDGLVQESWHVEDLAILAKQLGMV